jgi:hypothetical protein
MVEQTMPHGADDVLELLSATTIKASNLCVVAVAT